MIFGDIAKAIFGDKGLTGGVMDVLKATGVLKDPELALKAEQALREYEISKGSQEIEVEKIHAADRDSARKREMATQDKTPRNLAYLALVGFFAVLFLQFWIAIDGKSINTEIQRTIDITTGVLFAWVLAVKDYYFGSSSGSAKKNEMLERMTIK